MRVLILTHQRSGGLSLLSWIERELNFISYHEPFSINYYDEGIIYDVMNNDNIVVKEFQYNIEKAGFNLNDVISKFDKVIIHYRGNYNDVAISLTYFDKNDGTKMHKTYEMTDEWIKDNEEEIEKMKVINNEMYCSVQRLKIEGSLTTNYNGIYNDKSDIPKLLEFLNITYPRHLDILDKRHKLQNGDVGMDNVKVKRKII